MNNPLPTDLAAIFNEVRTERLILRRPRIEDGSAMFAIEGDPATNQYNPYGPDPNLAASEERLREWLRNWETYGFCYWAVVLPSSGNIIGFGGVRYIFWRERDILNLYYRFTPDAWGNGYATEMARTAVTLARKYLPSWPIVARIRARNIPSMRTAERAGLTRHPELDTEHVIFALGWTAKEA